MSKPSLHGQSIKTRVEALLGLNDPTSRARLHGQSIKTRVEAFLGLFHVIALPAVYTDNPLKQGLKLYMAFDADILSMSTRTIH